MEQTLHTTHLLKLLDKLCKYEMDPTSIVEDTERPRLCPQMDRGTDGGTDRWTYKVKPVYFVEAGGIIIWVCMTDLVWNFKFSYIHIWPLRSVAIRNDCDCQLEEWYIYKLLMPHDVCKFHSSAVLDWSQSTRLVSSSECNHHEWKHDHVEHFNCPNCLHAFSDACDSCQDFKWSHMLTMIAPGFTLDFNCGP